MIIDKSLRINNLEYKLIKEQVLLDLATPGRADFIVKSEKPLAGIVNFSIGISGRTNLVNFFTGYIEKSTMVDYARQRLFCRELSAILWAVLPVSARHVSMNDVLGIYSRKTGLSFVIQNTAYATTPRPVFQTVANGIHSMDSLGDVFRVKNYIWQQQADGRIFAGNWNDSRWADKPFNIDETFFQDVQVDGTKTMQAVPGLRPGVLLNGEYITSLQLKNGHEMVVTCGKLLNV
ncbi:hypothetical protein [Desulfosediminicola sp.]|uniref:hypothetical protein n=1 Tax=Desulfosediminicola sp. TaxID=2886825 RepID=UPI003AF1F555